MNSAATIPTVTPSITKPQTAAATANSERR